MRSFWHSTDLIHETTNFHKTINSCNITTEIRMIQLNPTHFRVVLIRFNASLYYTGFTNESDVCNSSFRNRSIQWDRWRENEMNRSYVNSHIGFIQCNKLWRFAQSHSAGFSWMRPIIFWTREDWIKVSVNKGHGCGFMFFSDHWLLLFNSYQKYCCTWSQSLRQNKRHRHTTSINKNEFW